MKMNSHGIDWTKARAKPTLFAPGWRAQYKVYSQCTVEIIGEDCGLIFDSVLQCVLIRDHYEYWIRTGKHSELEKGS